MTDETTTEQLVEIEGQAAEYLPPEGWRVVQVGEPLKGGDEYHAGLDRYIRPIEPQSEPKPQAEPVQVREGRWRTRGGSIRNLTPTPQDHESFPAAYPWWDGFDTWRNDGRCWAAQETTSDLVEYLGPIEQDKTQELETKTQELPEYAPPEGWRVVRFGEQLLPGDVWVNHDGTEQRSNILQWDASAVSGGRCIRRIKAEAQPEPEKIDELRSEVAYVQNLLGTERRRVTELEELVGSLRTINRGCENAVRDAGKENTALRNQLAAVKAELASVAADRQQLRVELDAAQQVPADSPELRQLRADLEQATLGRDTYRDGYERVLSDLETARETAKAEAVEAIVEWLEPIRLVDSAYLANATMQHLPQIMRHLTGLDSHAID